MKSKDVVLLALVAIVSILIYREFTKTSTMPVVIPNPQYVDTAIPVFIPTLPPVVHIEPTWTPFYEMPTNALPTSVPIHVRSTAVPEATGVIGNHDTDRSDTRSP